MLMSTFCPVLFFCLEYPVTEVFTLELELFIISSFHVILPIHVEVLRDPLGKPYVELHEGAAKTAEDLGITKIEVSISDTKDHAMAFAVGEGEAG